LKLLLPLILLLILPVIFNAGIIFHDDVSVLAKSSKEKKVMKTITKALDRATEGKPSKIDMLNISKFSDNSTIVVINKTGGPIVTPPNPPPNPPPEPTPTGNTTLVCTVGDFKDGKVIAAMKKDKCDITISLGDSGYGDTLALLKSLGFTNCVIGNHDAEEDGSKAIYQEALAYCKDSWYKIVGNGTTILIGINTNGEDAKTIPWLSNLLNHLPAKVKTVIIFSHKGGHVFKNAHHPAEASAIYSKIEDAGHANLNIYEVAGHNHNMAESVNGLWFIAGSGGAKKYTCGTDAQWNFCGTDTGYLRFTIDNKGSIASTFYDTNGNKIH
jgi:predicted phosphodiesterase